MFKAACYLSLLIPSAIFGPHENGYLKAGMTPLPIDKVAQHFSAYHLVLCLLQPCRSLRTWNKIVYMECMQAGGVFGEKNSRQISERMLSTERYLCSSSP